MSLLLGIDPGAWGQGVALLRDKELIRAAYVTIPKQPKKGYHTYALAAEAVAKWLNMDPRLLDRVVIEKPRIYPNMKGKDPNDLLDVLGSGAAFAGLCRPEAVVTRYPSEWKGQVPKSVMNKRVLLAMTEVERGRMEEAGTKDHNTLDGIGLAFEAVGRINERMLFRG